MIEEELSRLLLSLKPIAYRSDFAKICESVTAGIMLSQGYYWTGKSTKLGDGWFEKTNSEWEEETALSDKQQQTARHILSERGFMEFKRAGDRGKMQCKVNHRAVYQALVKLFSESDRQKGDSDQIGKKEILHRQKGDSKIGKKANLSLQRIHTENTSENKTLKADNAKLTTEIKKIFDENYTKLTGSRISWHGRFITQHNNAIKIILELVSGTYDERLAEIKARARKLYEMVNSDKARDGYWWKLQFLYSTLANHWNQIVPDAIHRVEKADRKKVKSWLESGEFTDEEIVKTLVDGISNKNLLPEGWQKWEKQVLEKIGTEKLAKYREWWETARTTSATAAAS